MNPKLLVTFNVEKNNDQERRKSHEKMSSFKTEMQLLPIKQNFNSTKTDSLVNSRKRSNKILPPKTTLEKIVEILNEASNLFKSQDNFDMQVKIDWALKEIASNSIYKYDKNNTNNDLFKYYSPDEIDIVESNSSLTNQNKIIETNVKVNNPLKVLEKSKTIKNGHKTFNLIKNNSSDEDDLLDLDQKALSIKKINVKKTLVKVCSYNHLEEASKSSHKEIKRRTSSNKSVHFNDGLERNCRLSLIRSIESNIKPLEISTFGVNFDVFSYSEKVGRRSLLNHIFYACISYNNCKSLLNIDFIDNFLEELRIGYTSEPSAFYHNVIF